MSNNKDDQVVGQYLDLQSKYVLKLLLDLDNISKLLNQYMELYTAKNKELIEANNKIKKLEEMDAENSGMLEEKDKIITELRSNKICTCKDKKKVKDAI